MFVITRHRVDNPELWLADARVAVAALAAQRGCLGIRIGAATDDASLYSIVSNWESVGDYRRALSAFDVKMNAIPLLSTAIDEPSAFETLHSNIAGAVSDNSPSRAFNADSFNLGDSLIDE